MFGSGDLAWAPGGDLLPATIVRVDFQSPAPHSASRPPAAGDARPCWLPVLVGGLLFLDMWVLLAVFAGSADATPGSMRLLRGRRRSAVPAATSLPF